MLQTLSYVDPLAKYKALHGPKWKLNVYYEAIQGYPFLL